MHEHDTRVKSRSQDFTVGNQEFICVILHWQAIDNKILPKTEQGFQSIFCVREIFP